jgi:hypothetical protein
MLIVCVKFKSYNFYFCIKVNISNDNTKIKIRTKHFIVCSFFYRASVYYPQGRYRLHPPVIYHIVFFALWLAGA